MNTKTISKVIRKKINEWTSSIKDEKVRKMVRNNTIVTGGAIASMLQGEKEPDYTINSEYLTTIIDRIF